MRVIQSVLPWIALWARRERRRISAWWHTRGIHPVTPPHTSTGVALFCVLRNSHGDLPGFLAHYRDLGVAQFHFLDLSGSVTGKLRALEGADITVWWPRSNSTLARSDTELRNGMMARLGHKRWCVSVDMHELLTIPHQDTRSLGELTAWLDDRNVRAVWALKLTMCGHDDQVEGCSALRQNWWFDTGNYRSQPDPALRHQIVQGGPLERLHFSTAPRRAPKLNKLALVKWDHSFAFERGGHAALPVWLNHPPNAAPSLALIDTSWVQADCPSTLEEAGPPSAKQHAVTRGASPAHAGSAKFDGWRQLRRLGLIKQGAWQ